MRQAIVFVHGIGWKRPLDTTRAFLDHVAGVANYWSKPERLGGPLELRRFTLSGERSGLPATDFYEFYWPHLIGEGSFLDTLHWLVRTALQPVWRVDRSLRLVLVSLQIALIIGLGWVLWFIASPYLSDAADPNSVAARRAMAVLVVTAALHLATNRWFTRVLAAAAVYLTPDPTNIKARQAIRRAGGSLLDQLHRDGSYSRIVVVGHSLGSVIAYDLVRSFWDEHRHPAAMSYGKQPEAKSFTSAIEELESSDLTGQQLEQFQQAQHRLWRENRDRSIPWLITDLVTLGSPLAHAPFLLDTLGASLERRFAERELPKCPPVRGDDDEVFYSLKYRRRGHDSEAPKNFWIGHHAAPFSVTRWTNLYFPTTWRSLGDLVGGPVARHFGSGVRDIAVRPSADGLASWYRSNIVAHSSYWMPNRRATKPGREDRKKRDRQTSTKEVLIALDAALRLEALRSLQKWPTPGPELGEESPVRIR